MNVPLISIVLPVYNGARYLSTAIDAILSQTFEDWELILVNDGSTDDSASIMNRYTTSDSRINCIHNEKNVNLPNALNIGFAAAQGRYFTWTSHDNMYRPHALATLYTFLESHPQVDIVYSDYTQINAEGDKIGYARAALPERLVMKSVVGASFLYRREVHEALKGYDAQQVFVEDYDYWLRASIQFMLATLNEDLYLYRFHPNSLTTTKRRQIMEKRAALLHERLPHLDWATPRDLALGYLHLSELAVSYKAPANPLYYIRQALSLHPMTVLRYFARVSIVDRVRSFYRKLK